MSTSRRRARLLPTARATRAATVGPLAVVLIVGLSGLLLAPLALWAYGNLASTRLPNTRLEGTLVPRSGSLDEFIATRARLWEGESVAVGVGYHEFHPVRAELGASIDLAETKAEIVGLTHSGNPLVAWSAWFAAYYGAGHEVRFRPHIGKTEALGAYAERIAAEVNRDPLPGSYDPAGKPVPGIEGETVDLEGLKHVLRRALAKGTKQVAFGTIVTPAPLARRSFQASAAEASVLMVVQETEYRAGHGGRGTNIELAARKLDGHIVMPGAELSFNAVVGKRDAARGFASALELFNGELVQGVGGGVCQVAGTLHAAAFFAGLEVLEYRPHSRLNQLAYLRPGLDTMVAWPDQARSLAETKDMRVRNTYPFPVRVRAYTIDRTPAPSTLRIELYGAARPFRVDWSFEEVGRVPFSEVLREEPELQRGTERVQQQGLDGLVIMRRRTVYEPSRRVQEETRVAYPPTPRIIMVGTGGKG
ncbi:MAG: Vancomycin B-type resistance protein VanW [Myxococcaceae bacterium]|nr:Vancomycin B-type resistance protein VanW [Myxococcaceae bacterium]